MRLAAAIGVIAVTLAAAVYIHQRHPLTRRCAAPGYTEETANGPRTVCARYESVLPRLHPSWEDPVAVGIAVGGVAIAAGIITYRRRSSIAPG